MNRPKSRRPTKMSKAPVRDGPTFDEIIEDVHTTRSKILARFDNDMDRYIEYLNSNPALDTPSAKLVRSKPPENPPNISLAKAPAGPAGEGQDNSFRMVKILERVDPAEIDIVAADGREE